MQSLPFWFRDLDSTWTLVYKAFDKVPSGVDWSRRLGRLGSIVSRLLDTTLNWWRGRLRGSGKLFYSLEVCDHWCPAGISAGSSVAPGRKLAVLNNHPKFAVTTSADHTPSHIKSGKYHKATIACGSLNLAVYLLQNILRTFMFINIYKYVKPLNGLKCL